MAAEDGKTSQEVCLVIGGSGFLGHHIVEKLLADDYKVRVFDIRSTFDDGRVKFFVGDLCQEEDLLPALEGVDIVFHCATPSPLSNNRELFEKVNCEGTKNILEACKKCGVKRLVLTSSASVIYEGKDIVGGLEDMPYAAKPMDDYTATKIQQEKIVLEANGEDLKTVAIRPHGIFGPRDPHMVPTTARLSQAGKTKYIIGNGKNLVDFTYVGNVVDGHVLAAQKLLEENVAGKAYHITNDAPLPFWDFMKDIITGLGYPAPKTKLPFWLVYALAMLLQLVVVILRACKKSFKPTFTPMTVSLAGTHHYYSCERAKDSLGYRPRVSMEEGIARTLDHFHYLKKEEEKPQEQPQEKPQETSSVKAEEKEEKKEEETPKEPEAVPENEEKGEKEKKEE